MSKKTFKIILKQSEKLYSFSEITYSSDGSAIIAFPYIPEERGIAQSILLLRKKHTNIEFKPQILKDTQSERSHSEKFRISYHTTGQVNYHGSSFSPLFLEPLYSITKQNLFLLMSFHQLSRFISISSLENERDPFIIIDISQLFGMRIDICFSIVPASFTIKPQDYNSFLIAHSHVYQILIELFRDENSFNLSEIYSPADCVKVVPNFNENPQKMLTKSDACLRYKHILYQTNDLIILPPNSDGKIEVIFSTVMRIPPWIKIEFLNPEYEIKCVKKEDFRIFFKIYDRRHSQFIKDAKEIKITGVTLDAEIYDDSEIHPQGFI